jgi:hypothetical protein
MALVLKSGAVFLHIPKTGGNWVTKVLQECNLIDSSVGPKHADINRLFLPWSGGMAGAAGVVGHEKTLIRYLLRKKLGPLRNGKPFLFCFVRNPFSWLESYFKYMSQPTQHWLHWGNEYDPNKWHPTSMLNGTGDLDFNQYLQNIIKVRPGYVTEMFGWYTTPEMDFIGKQENLKADLVNVLKKLNLSFSEDFIMNYPMVGTSLMPENKLVWDDKLRKEIYKLEYAGFVRYGYLDHNV